jgi:hypothetical protein
MQDYFKPHQYKNPISQFLRDQQDKEIWLGCFSVSFGTDLLLGMYAMPIHVIPKLHTTNFRLIMNLIASDFAPNTMIEKANITNLPLDMITELGSAPISFRRVHGNSKLVM